MTKDDILQIERERDYEHRLPDYLQAFILISSRPSDILKAGKAV